MTADIFLCGKWAGEIAQQVKMLAAKPDYLSLVTRTFVVEGENYPESCPVASAYVLWHMRMFIYSVLWHVHMFTHSVLWHVHVLTYK